jgi:2,4-dienoyl-CoA reductase-like NADH-dependent reductase (Old Yellow Enzyme family)
MDGTEYAESRPKPMTVEDIQDALKEYAAAAKRALEAGFDGVEIHCRLNPRDAFNTSSYR